MERPGLKTDLAPLSNFQFAANRIPKLGMDGTVFEIYTRAVCCLSYAFWSDPPPP